MTRGQMEIDNNNLNSNTMKMSSISMRIDPPMKFWSTDNMWFQLRTTSWGNLVTIIVNISLIIQMNRLVEELTRQQGVLIQMRNDNQVLLTQSQNYLQEAKGFLTESKIIISDSMSGLNSNISSFIYNYNNVYIKFVNQTNSTLNVIRISVENDIKKISNLTDSGISSLEKIYTTSSKSFNDSFINAMSDISNSLNDINITSTIIKNSLIEQEILYNTSNYADLITDNIRKLNESMIKTDMENKLLILNLTNSTMNIMSNLTNLSSIISSTSLMVTSHTSELSSHSSTINTLSSTIITKLNSCQITGKVFWMNPISSSYNDYGSGTTKSFSSSSSSGGSTQCMSDYIVTGFCSGDSSCRMLSMICITCN
jgi:hypothetical protein